VAVKKAAELLRGKDGSKAGVVLSAEHSQEDNLAMLWLAREILKTNQVYVSGRPEGTGDDILRNSDKNPNSTGVAELVDVLPLKSFSEFEAAVAAGQLDTVVSLGSSLPHAGSAAPAKVRTLIALATHEGPWAERAAVLLPASSWAEADGTFVNANGITLESDKAISPQGDSRPAWRLIAELGRALDVTPNWRKGADVQSAVPKSARISSAPPPAPSAGANG
jgi:NADH-quinone oxidoreductase subunit G